MIGREGHEWILCRNIDPGLRDPELFHKLGKIIAKAERAYLQIRGIEIAQSGSIYGIVPAYLTCRIGIFGAGIGRSPIIHLDIVSPSAHQVKIAARIIQGADQEAPALEDAHGREIEAFIGYTRIEAPDKIGIGVLNLPVVGINGLA